MSRVAPMRTALVDAVKALLPGIEVKASGSTKACLNRISTRSSAFVIYGGWSLEGQQRAAQTIREGRDTWFVALVVESYRSAEDAFARAGGADEMLDAVIGPGGLTGTKIGGVTYPTVNVRLDGVELTEGEVVGLDEGGTWGYVATFRTNPYKL